jgi:hypothetical protein
MIVDDQDLLHAEERTTERRGSDWPFGQYPAGQGLPRLDAVPNQGKHMNPSAAARRYFLLAAFSAAFAAPVQAQTLSAHSFALYEEEPGPASLTVLSGPGGPLSSVSYAGGGLASGGYGEAAFGALHASASAIAAGDSAQTRGQGGAFWIDNVTFASASLAGAAFARFSFSLSGALSSTTGPTSAGAAANSTISALVRANGSHVFSSSGQLLTRNGAIEINQLTRGVATNGSFQSDPVSSLTGTFSFDVPIVFNSPFQLMAEMTAFTTAQTSFAGDLASAHSNFGSSGYWGGLSGVHLADGTLLSGYSVSSASGFDWTSAYGAPVAAPIPEPETYAMLLAGLGLLGFVARRRLPANATA